MFNLLGWGWSLFGANHRSAKTMKPSNCLLCFWKYICSLTFEPQRHPENATFPLCHVIIISLGCGISECKWSYMSGSHKSHCGSFKKQFASPASFTWIWEGFVFPSAPTLIYVLLSVLPSPPPLTSHDFSQKPDLSTSPTSIPSRYPAHPSMSLFQRMM